MRSLVGPRNSNCATGARLMFYPSRGDYERIDREMRQFIRDYPWPGSAPGPIDTDSYDTISRRSVYENSRGMRF